MRSGYRKIEILVPANRVKDFLAVLRNERTLVIATKSDIDHLKEIYGNAGTVQNHKSKTETEGETPWS